jgi:peptide/nickel transport system ATP-binding protein
MIFQDPLTSLDEAFTIGRQLTETIRAHKSLSASAAEKLAVETMERVGIASAKRRLKAYPHEFSGGMRQRVMIAMALVLKPRLVIADEPTTAVDVTTQAQILELIRDLQHETGMSVLLISHDLSIVLDVADRVMVMYAGQIVESASNHLLYNNPSHPYTQGLLRSKLSMLKEIEYVTVMRGQIPALRDRPKACRFAPRCPHALDVCVKTDPSLVPVTEIGALLRCYNPQPWSPP